MVERASNVGVVMEDSPASLFIINYLSLIYEAPPGMKLEKSVATYCVYVPLRSFQSYKYIYMKKSRRPEDVTGAKTLPKSPNRTEHALCSCAKISYELACGPKTNKANPLIYLLVVGEISEMEEQKFLPRSSSRSTSCRSVVDGEMKNIETLYNSSN